LSRDYDIEVWLYDDFSICFGVLGFEGGEVFVLEQGLAQGSDAEVIVESVAGAFYDAEPIEGFFEGTFENFADIGGCSRAEILVRAVLKFENWGIHFFMYVNAMFDKGFDFVPGIGFEVIERFGNEIPGYGFVSGSGEPVEKVFVSVDIVHFDEVFEFSGVERVVMADEPSDAFCCPE